MVGLIAWSVAVVLVMWAAVAGTAVVALDTVWLLAASALLSAALLLFAMALGCKTVDDARRDLRTATTLETRRALD